MLHARELGINAMVVMEQFSELGMVLSVAKRLGVRPAIGIRAKLNTQHRGHWGSTSGGLPAAAVARAVLSGFPLYKLPCLCKCPYSKSFLLRACRK